MSVGGSNKATTRFYGPKHGYCYPNTPEKVWLIEGKEGFPNDVTSITDATLVVAPTNSVALLCGGQDPQGPPGTLTDACWAFRPEERWDPYWNVSAFEPMESPRKNMMRVGIGYKVMKAIFSKSHAFVYFSQRLT